MAALTVVSKESSMAASTDVSMAATMAATMWIEEVFLHSD